MALSRKGRGRIHERRSEIQLALHPQSFRVSLAKISSSTAVDCCRTSLFQ
jgi:hypothetical protein